MYKTRSIVRLHDLDMAGILYFPRQFRYVHEALEDFLDSEGINFGIMFREFDYLFVIVHVESDYLAPLTLSDEIEVILSVEKIGNTSFILNYQILKENEVVGTARTVHVCLNKSTRKKIPVPEQLRAILQKHLEPA